MREPDDFKDSDEDRLRNQPQEMMRGQRSPFKDANTFSIIVAEKTNTQLTSRGKNSINLQRSPQMGMNNR